MYIILVVVGWWIVAVHVLARLVIFKLIVQVLTQSIVFVIVHDYSPVIWLFHHIKLVIEVILIFYNVIATHGLRAISIILVELALILLVELIHKGLKLIGVVSSGLHLHHVVHLRQLLLLHDIIDLLINAFRLLRGLLLIHYFLYHRNQVNPIDLLYLLKRLNQLRRRYLIIIPLLQLRRRTLRTLAETSTPLLIIRRLHRLRAPSIRTVKPIHIIAIAIRSPITSILIITKPTITWRILNIDTLWQS